MFCVNRARAKFDQAQKCRQRKTRREQKTEDEICLIIAFAKMSVCLRKTLYLLPKVC